MNNDGEGKMSVRLELIQHEGYEEPVKLEKKYETLLKLDFDNYTQYQEYINVHATHNEALHKFGPDITVFSYETDDGTGRWVMEYKRKVFE